MPTSRNVYLPLLLVAVVCLPSPGRAANLSAASSTAYTVPNGTFEAPALAASPGYQYAPTGSGWTFVNGAGLSRNGTAFTSGNPNAPQGAQVMFLQGVAAATRTIHLPAGYYVFGFAAAQRGNLASTQRVELRIDGATVLGVTPAGATYQRFTTGPVLLASGAHAVELHGTNPQGTDSTAFVDDLTATRVRDISLSGFESPALPASPGYAYAPTGGPWSFSGLGGLSRNGSGFTVSNPNAPEGAQVLLLQGASSATTDITIPRSGYYRFRVRAALRANSPSQPTAKNLRVTVGTTQVGEFRLAGTQYAEYLSTALSLEAGTSVVGLTGVDTLPGDHTALVDDLRMEMLHDWWDPQVWGGTVPGGADTATVGAGSAVCLRGAVSTGSITVGGELLGVQNAGFDVTTRYVMVMGSGARLEVGQELTPFPNTGVFTLVGNPDGSDVMGMGNKFIGAMGSGTLRLHGQERVSWTQLGANAPAGSGSIVVKEAVDWRAGDTIVVVSSHRDWNEAEKRTLTGLTEGNTRLALSSPLAYAHTGVVKTYTDGARSWTADLRAQVGLLTHNIKVQGDTASQATGHGGHVMIMDNATAYFSGVELFNMGQKKLLGRYPFHWHMLGSAGAGQYFKNSSIHQSYNRAITIHGTESTLVENNFFYDHVGHGVFLEDGSERFNVIKRNVTLLTRRPAPGEQLTPSDNELDQVQNRTPASYWITNPQNTFEDNVAAGTQGTGFWFAFPERPMGLSATDARFSSLRPRTLPMISFKGNSAHSTMSGFDIFDGLSPSHSIEANLGWSDPALHLIENSTWYANELGIYTGIGAGGPSDNLVFRNNVLVENTVGAMMASYSIIDQSLFVANSGEGLVGGTRHAYRVYDGAGQVRDSHFVGWDAANANFLINTGAAIKHPNHQFTGNTMSPVGPPRISLEDFDIPPVVGAHANHPGHPRYWSIVLRDQTGGISGKANTSIISSHPFMRVGDEFRPANWERAWRSDHRFVLSRLSYSVPFEQTPNVAVTREKAGTPTAHVFYIDVDGYREWHQLPFIVNEGFEYTYAYEALPAVKSVAMNMEDATAGDQYVARFKDFGKLGGLRFSSTQGGFPSHASLASLRSAATSGYFLQSGGDLYIKAVATARNQTFIINWDTNIAVPALDTDGDQLPDSAEIRAGRHPFDAGDLGAEFVPAGDFEGWSTPVDITGFASTGGVLTGTSSGIGDAQVVNTAYNFNASRVAKVQVRMRASQNTGVQLFFATSTLPGFSGTRVASGSYTGNGAYQTVTLEVAGQPDWTGTITDLRLDPVSGLGIQFDIDWIRAVAP
ncbi:hypothetical protein LY474_08660 [Myxococcus stipitatus]|uniref:G8 domain-containing protein n=1 Tax=Myxococcus stipitatus TaxID=83455 RepID=UPI001F28EAAA|nr:G8 domain-containing protein [Myxococcus stipitatus]MCE9667879.1 hypothetical protein [Myxococcus stipitatus]